MPRGRDLRPNQKGRNLSDEYDGMDSELTGNRASGQEPYTPSDVGNAIPGRQDTFDDMEGNNLIYNQQLDAIVAKIQANEAALLEQRTIQQNLDSAMKEYEVDVKGGISVGNDDDAQAWLRADDKINDLTAEINYIVANSQNEDLKQIYGFSRYADDPSTFYNNDTQRRTSLLNDFASTQHYPPDAYEGQSLPADSSEAPELYKWSLRATGGRGNSITQDEYDRERAGVFPDRNLEAPDYPSWATAEGIEAYEKTTAPLGATPGIDWNLTPTDVPGVYVNDNGEEFIDKSVEGAPGTRSEISEPDPEPDPGSLPGDMNAGEDIKEGLDDEDPIEEPPMTIDTDEDDDDDLDVTDEPHPEEHPADPVSNPDARGVPLPGEPGYNGYIGSQGGDTHAEVNPTESQSITFRTNNGMGNDMRSFAQSHEEMANPGYFSDLVASSALLMKKKAVEVVDGGLVEGGEAIIDKVFQYGGIPGLAIMKEPLKETLRTYIKTSSTSRYSRPLQDGEVDGFTAKRLSHASIYPFLSMGITFYLGHLSETFAMPSFDGFSGGYARDYIMSILTMLNMGEKESQYAMFSLQELPPSLLSAYRKNKTQVTPIDDDEQREIMKYVASLAEKYKMLFNEELWHALEREHAGDTLFHVLSNLHNPHTLHEIAQSIATTDSIIYDVMNNDGLLLSLIILLGEKLRPQFLNKEFAFLHHLIEGIVYYDRTNSQNGAVIRASPTLEAMLEGQKGEEPVQLLQKNNVNYVIFRGTDFQSPADLVRNVLQKGGSDSIHKDPLYNDTLSRGRKLLKVAKQNAIRTGGEVEIVAYSVGSHDALYLSLGSPTTKTTIYHPYFSNNQRTTNLMAALKSANANVRVLTTHEDPISRPGLSYYQDFLNVGYRKKSKFFNAHALENHYG